MLLNSKIRAFVKKRVDGEIINDSPEKYYNWCIMYIEQHFDEFLQIKNSQEKIYWISDIVFKVAHCNLRPVQKSLAVGRPKLYNSAFYALQEQIIGTKKLLKTINKIIKFKE